MKPFKFLRPDTCPICNTERSLELYNSNGNPMNYSVMLDRHEDLEKKVIDLSYIKCKKCHHQFFPRWENNKIIFPLEPMNENDFMSYFRASKDK